jgi:hypothetical protein
MNWRPLSREELRSTIEREHAECALQGSFCEHPTRRQGLGKSTSAAAPLW